VDGRLNVRISACATTVLHDDLHPVTKRGVGMGNKVCSSDCGCGDKDDASNTVFVFNPVEEGAPPAPVQAATRSRDAVRNYRSANAYEPAEETRQAAPTGCSRTNDRFEKNVVDHEHCPPPAQDDQSGYDSAPTGDDESIDESDGVIDGFGIQNLEDGSVFEGHFKGGTRHGEGKFTWSTGCQYQGQFEYNEMHGQGTYTWNDGSSFRGQWIQNSMGGRGIMRWPDGRMYDGEFDAGKKHGDGKLTWPDGRAYDGQWAFGRQHGIGTAMTATGQAGRSQWEHGQFVKWIEVDEDKPSVLQTAVRVPGARGRQ